MKKIMILVIFLSFLTGCWNYRELNELGITGAIAIDYDEEKELFDVGVQIFNVKKDGSSGSGAGNQGSPIVFYSNKGKTIHEAIRNIIHTSPKRLYIGHLDIVVVGETLSKEHLKESLDFLFRDSESRKDFEIILAKGVKPNDVIKILTPLESISSTSIKHSIITNNLYKGDALSISYDEFLATTLNEGIEAVLPIISIKGEPSKGISEKATEKSDVDTDLEIKGMAYFKGDKLKGFLSSEESVGYSILTNKLKQTVLSTKCDDKNYMAFEIIKIKTKIKPNVKDKKLDIEIGGSATLSEFNCDLTLKSNENMKKISKLTEKKINEVINKTIDNMQKEYKLDIIGIGNMIYKTDLKYWNKNKKNWNEIFSDLEVTVKSKIEVSRKGSSVTPTRDGNER